MAGNVLDIGATARSLFRGDTVILTRITAAEIAQIVSHPDAKFPASKLMVRRHPVARAIFLEVRDV